MGSGHNHFLSFHLHLHHHHHHHHHSNNHKQYHQEEEEGMKKLDENMIIPKGYMAVMVGHEGEEQKRFMIPVIYIYHPLFIELLKEAEEEYGFHHRGPINIPCDIQKFSNVEGLIKKDDFFYNHHHHHHHHHNHHHHHIWCFKA